jgi:hypothetical protein
MEIADGVHVEDDGTVFEGTIRQPTNDSNVNLIDVKGLKLIFQRPDGSEVEQPAVLSGTGEDGMMRWQAGG